MLGICKNAQLGPDLDLNQLSNQLLALITELSEKCR
jgi:hypothetical protein